MSDPWFHERTEDGWQILDENRLTVAFVQDSLHEREDDALRIAHSVSPTTTGERLAGRLNLIIGNLESQAQDSRQRISTHVGLIARDAQELADRARSAGPDAADPTWISVRTRELIEARIELRATLATVRELKNLAEFAERSEL